MRSKIVHGSKYKKIIKIKDKEYTLDKLVLEIEELVRNSIKKALPYKNHEDLLKEIDELILK